MSPVWTWTRRREGVCSKLGASLLYLVCDHRLIVTILYLFGTCGPTTNNGKYVRQRILQQAQFQLSTTTNYHTTYGDEKAPQTARDGGSEAAHRSIRDSVSPLNVIFERPQYTTQGSAPATDDVNRAAARCGVG
ncbi:hypothetical protein PIB30_040532 [Stylosanthes scabra]|uniref:Uncharacterized protein n=1 Tax=Stylosanthes scabra TaxID=79078 RepID=A0ABU6SFG2_9FABA|nr:hypothetical protein [Stylosanthes scabra]